MYSSDMSSISESSCRNSSLSALYVSGMVISFRQSLMSLVSSLWVTCLYYAICWSLSTWGWWWKRLRLSYNVGFELYGAGSANLSCMKVDVGESAVAIRWWFVRVSEAFDGLTTMKLNGLSENASIMPKAVVHSWVLFYSTIGPICTSRPSSITTKAVLSDHTGIFVSLATRTGRKESSSMTIASCAFFLPLGSSGMFLLARIVTDL